MREFLFRGKRDYNGEWVEGSLLVWPDGSAEMCHSNPNDGDELLKVIVRPETVGQYTEVTDKNGKQIFEGDIARVRFIDDVDLCVVTFEHGSFYLSSINGAIRDETLWHAWYCDADIEVVGNIYDNIELLEVTDDA